MFNVTNSPSLMSYCCNQPDHYNMQSIHSLLVIVKDLAGKCPRWKGPFESMKVLGEQTIAHACRINNLQHVKAASCYSECVCK